MTGQLGLERTPEEYVAKMVEVFREVRRVLRSDGTCWVNMGDSYAVQGGQKRDAEESQKNAARAKTNGYDVGGWSGKTEHIQRCTNTAVSGLKPKDLCGIPWRLAFALQADGWWLRQDIIWHKPNPMPESVTDRCTKSHEYIFLMSKSARYFFDAEAIKGPSENKEGPERFKGNHGISKREYEPNTQGWDGSGLKHTYRDPFAGRNKRSVWTVTTNPYSEAHFATFPPDLIKPCILAGTSARGCCPKCRAPWERMVESTKSFESGSGRSGNPINGKQRLGASPTNSTPDIRMGPVVSTKTTGWQATCTCGETEAQPCTILDPFGGSGTSGMVALELGRRAILIELNPAYIKLAERRCHVTPGLQLA